MKLNWNHFFVFLNVSLFALSVQAKPSTLLNDVEAHYRDSKSVKMVVSKLVKMKLLDKTKLSEGEIIIKKGKIRWETQKPEHTLVLADGRAIWLVDYPEEAGDPVRVIKATDPKKSQPHAIVAFLMGKGKIGDQFAAIAEKPEDNLVRIDLKPREERDEVQWLTLFVSKEEKIIKKLSFEDSAGNVTTLDFKNIKFDEAVESKLFKFKPPKNSEMQILN